VRKPTIEQPEPFLPVAVFEALDEIAHGLRIARHGPRPVVDWGRGNRRGRQAWFAGVVRQRHAEPRAQGRGDEIDFGEAVAAKKPMAANARTARDTHRRQQKIGHRAEARAPRPPAPRLCLTQDHESHDTA